MQVSLITPHPDEKGDEHGNVQLQRQETSSQKLDQPGKVLQQGGNDQRNAGRCKHVSEQVQGSVVKQVQGSVAKKNDHCKHTYNKTGVN